MDGGMGESRFRRRPGRRPRWPQRGPQSWVLAAAATVFSLLLLECGARLLLDPPRYHSGPLQLDPELGFRGIADHRHEVVDELGSFPFELNSQGLRGREVAAGEAKPGVLRVAFVGDSFLVGQSLREEQLMTALTERALREAGLDAEVYNLSGVDYGTGQEILLLEQLGRPLGLDAVVLALYPGNDLINNSLALAGLTRVSAGDAIRPYLVTEGDRLRVRWTHPFRALLRRHSRLFATLERRALSLGLDRGIDWLAPWPPPLRSNDLLRLGRAPREELELFRRHDPGHRWEKAWETTFSLLRAFRDKCKAMEARLLTLVIPSASQVQRTAKIVALDIATRRVSQRSLDALLDWNLPERRLGEFFQAESIEARLLLAPLREAAKSDPGVYLYTRDEHLGRQGHLIAARPVIDWLMEEGEGAEGTGGETGRVRGRPIRALPNASAAPSLLDFRGESHRGHLGDGWLSWQPDEPDQPGGWWLGSRGLVVVPATGGDFVVRGLLSSEAAPPVDGRVEPVGGVRQPFHLERAGPFEIRFPWAPDISSRSSEGYVAVILASQGRRPGELLIQEIGFEPTAEPEGGGE